MVLWEPQGTALLTVKVDRLAQPGKAAAAEGTSNQSASKILWLPLHRHSACTHRHTHTPYRPIQREIQTHKYLSISLPLELTPFCLLCLRFALAVVVTSIMILLVCLLPCVCFSFYVLLLSPLLILPSCSSSHRPFLKLYIETAFP